MLPFQVVFRQKVEKKVGKKVEKKGGKKVGEKMRTQEIVGKKRQLTQNFRRDSKLKV